MNETKLKILIIISMWCCFILTAAARSQETSGKTFYDVAAFVWPSYHPDDRAKIFWPMGIGEWETVMTNQPKFEGHAQPRYPLWGYINEADPYVAEMEINAAADHGVNVFIFDWYWYDGMPYLEGHLNDGYLQARNNDRVKFYLMWANHDVKLIWDKRNADDAATGKNTSIIWQGGVDRDEFETIVDRIITRYFSHPSYYTIENKPVFMIYDMQTFINGLGGLEQAIDAIDWFRAQVVKAGFEGLELQLAMRRDTNRSLKSANGAEIGTQKEIVELLGFDSLTHYQFVHFVEVDQREYADVMPDVVSVWNNISDWYNAAYYPQVSVGWDNSPRTRTHVGKTLLNNTPEQFAKALRRAKQFINDRSEQAPLITINSWNEWTETSYLQPCTMYGYGYLQAVKSVFVEQER